MSSTSIKIDYIKKDLPDIVIKLGYGLFALGLIVAALAYFTDPTRAAYNNLIVLMFLTSIGLGALFMIGIEYLMGAVWSVPFRRVMEVLAGVLIVLPIVAIPVYFNMHDMYHWTHHDVVMNDAILKSKEPYLNMTFFTVRIAVFFLLWIAFYFMITGNSRKQDKTGDQKLTTRNIRLSAVFMPVFAITLTFASIDWMMSLEPHWFSTMYGVYYFSGTILAAIAAGTFIIIKLNENGYFVKGINSDHYYALGALLFAFINFWAYIAFSQYMLYWYANLPEETFWFIARWEGSWAYVSGILIFVHFVVPYFGLLSQPSKSNASRLKFMSLWILFAHIVDLFWLVMPTYSKEGVKFGWIEIGFPVLAIGIIIIVFSMLYKKMNMMPIGDPKLKRGINFRL